MANHKKRKAANDLGEDRPSKANKKAKTPEAKSPMDEFWDDSLFLGVEDVSFNCYTPDLVNPINRIWQPQNFRNINYKFVQTSTRLATRFWEELVNMDNSPLDKVVNCSHDTVKVEAICNASKQSHFAYNEPSGKPEDRKTKLAAAVRRLADIVSFEPSADYKGGGGTECLGGQALPRGFKKQHPGEWPSRVFFSKQDYETLVRLTRSGDDPAWLMIAQWRFAVLLVHETVHALQNGQKGAGDRYTVNSVFLHTDPEKAPLAEIGIEAEAALFSGTIELRFTPGNDEMPLKRYRYSDRRQGGISGVAGVMVQWQWPCNTVWRHYHENRYLAALRKGYVFSDADVAWRVPLSYFARHFQTDFWELDVAKRGVEALQPPREVGHRFGYDYDNWETTLISGADDEGVPDGYHLNRFGDLILR